MSAMLTSIVSLPLALGGESAGGDSTGVAIVSLVSIVGGYVLLALLWHFVFRDKAKRGGKRRSD
jgi:hypothetical protein